MMIDAEIHVFSSTLLRMAMSTSGIVTTVSEIVKAPVETSKYFSPYMYMTLYIQFKAPRNPLLRSSLPFSLAISRMMRPKKHANIIKEPTR